MHVVLRVEGLAVGLVRVVHVIEVELEFLAGGVRPGSCFPPFLVAGFLTIVLPSWCATSSASSWSMKTIRCAPICFSRPSNGRTRTATWMFVCLVEGSGCLPGGLAGWSSMNLARPFFCDSDATPDEDATAESTADDVAAVPTQLSRIREASTRGIALRCGRRSGKALGPQRGRKFAGQNSGCAALYRRASHPPAASGGATGAGSRLREPARGVAVARHRVDGEHGAASAAGRSRDSMLAHGTALSPMAMPASMMFPEALITPWRYVATRRSSVLDRAHDGAVVDVEELDGVVSRRQHL